MLKRLQLFVLLLMVLGVMPGCQAITEKPQDRISMTPQSPQL